MSTTVAFFNWLTLQHGVAHTSAARAAGFTTRRIADAVDAGEVLRVRRSWLVSPTCDPRRASAARVGGRVTCVSGAALRGLWVPSEETVHIAVPGTASRLDTEGLTVHWSTGPAPVVRNSVDDHPLNMLFHAARCLPVADAAMLWESAIRKGVVVADQLPRVQWRSSAASELADLASSLSDSGLETRFAWIMRGCGVRVAQQIWIDGHPVDGLIGESLIVQIDGFAYHQAADRRRDIAADARLVLRGYTVLRFDHQQVLFAGDDVRNTVLTAMAQGLHRRRVS